MVLLKRLMFFFIFYELIVDLDAIVCPKGQRATRQNRCEACPEGYYQPEATASLHCKPCTTCEENRGSFAKERCTKETDTICECRGGFVSWGSDSSTCKCDIGFGLTRGVDLSCSECKDGYFNNMINSPCRKWKECKSGVNITGTKTTDVICNKLKNNPDITTTSITRATSHRPHEDTQAQNIHTTTTTTTTAPPGHTITTKKSREAPPSPPSNTGNHKGMILLIIGVVGLLVLTAVTCKLHITPSKDSLCRRPVEESGDGSLSSLKLNPEP
ncbi:tumor necrosis factor receptor superfamily member 1B isoform X2 [Trachinotus anak]|uniref:tumor necrosis factor receptor superfamily member 1B isoform X2 n=1 Tax=Trachinotus anak TaxID=443729 RepID=UPI0039F231DE